MGYSTPEDAARDDIPAQFVRVVGVVVRGDAAIVAQLTNDREPFEIDTTLCFRDDEGWGGGSSGNSSCGFIGTGEGVGTVVVWDEAPAGMVAARFEYDELAQVVTVENGCALAAFDEVPERDQWAPRLAAWIDSAGHETSLPAALGSPREVWDRLAQRLHDSASRSGGDDDGEP